MGLEPTTGMIKRFIDAYRRRRLESRSRLSRYTNRIVTLLALAWLLLVFFPHLLFAHSVSVGQFKIYSDRSIAPEIEEVIREATARLQGTEFFTDAVTFDIFIAHDRWRQRVLNPRASGAFGAGFVFTGNTVLNRCDIENDTCFNDREEFNERPLHAVIAHECTHHLLADELGMIKYFRLPEWKNEGYCEYVSGGSSFDKDRGVKVLRAGETHNEPAFRYLTYLLAVGDALDERGMTVVELFESDVSFESILEAAVAWEAEGDGTRR
jgi:hypothetical protein